MKTLVVPGAKVSLVIRLHSALAVVLCFEAVSSKILIGRFFRQQIAPLDGLLLCSVHEVLWLDAAMRVSFFDRSCLCVRMCAQHSPNQMFSCSVLIPVHTHTHAHTHTCPCERVANYPSPPRSVDL